MNYAELHARSAFSFLRGASSPPALAEEAARLELPAVALCDRDGVYGAPRFYQAAREHSVRAPVGAEITLEDGSVLPLLAATRTGYQNLCQLITTAKLTERRTGPGQLFVTAITNNRPPAPEPAPLAHARSHCRAGPCVRAAPFCSAEPGADPAARKRPCFATWAELAAHAEGLIALTGDEEGPVRRAWQTGCAAAAAPPIRQARRTGPSSSPVSAISPSAYAVSSAQVAKHGRLRATGSAPGSTESTRSRSRPRRSW